MISCIIFIKAETESLDHNTDNTNKGDSHIIEESEDDVEIVEDENGQCTVRIKPKPIKLKIINPYAAQNSGSPNKQSSHGKKRKLSSDEQSCTNGHLNDENEFSHGLPTAKIPRADSNETHNKYMNIRLHDW